MKNDEKIVTIDEMFSGTAQLDENDAYLKQYILRPDLFEKLMSKAKHRWENGGKEIHDKLIGDPNFAETEEYRNYFKKWGIPIP
ncbi:hypothetical protein LJC30_06530 [Odoribacter sp. OttesenSCG-928-L07]|nr:hypothetical protein [Odoribacter sp. OttesenSCG-928-L07]MDL2238764.1 hypothetical protein [Bacteroidales bacterium OttesenSCG-928-L14]MDL2241253.1 hypothetical protein [Bacteroidales bacterium OttesenSCG-928-K22]